MKLRPGGYAFRQLRLDVHVNVFQLHLPLELAGGDFPGDAFEAATDGGKLGGGEDADLFQHGSVGDGASDVMLPQTPVKRDGF